MKNVLRVRRYFKEMFNIDIPVINADQMPMHRNESCGSRTMSFKNNDVFVKENYHLSRDRMTVMTQVSSDETIDLPIEFVFKGVGMYQLQNTLSWIKNTYRVF